MTFNPMKHRIPVLKRLVPSVKKRLGRARTLDEFTLRASSGAVFLLNSENFVDRQIAFYDDFERAQTRYLFDQMQRTAAICSSTSAPISGSARSRSSFAASPPLSWRSSRMNATACSWGRTS